MQIDAEKVELLYLSVTGQQDCSTNLKLWRISSFVQPLLRLNSHLQLHQVQRSMWQLHTEKVPGKGR